MLLIMIEIEKNKGPDACLIETNTNTTTIATTTTIVKTSKMSSSSTHGIRHKAHTGLSGIFDKFF